MSGLVGKTGKSGLIGIDRVFIGKFGPSAHVTDSTVSQYIDLSNHANMHSTWQNYVTESGHTVTIVKSGLYNFDCRVLANSDSGAEVSLYVEATGYNQYNARLVETSGSNKWHTVQVNFTVQLVTGNTVYQTIANSDTGTYHHHSGTNWTAMQITYLG